MPRYDLGRVVTPYQCHLSVGLEPAQRPDFKFFKVFMHSLVLRFKYYFCLTSFAFLSHQLQEHMIKTNSSPNSPTSFKNIMIKKNTFTIWIWIISFNHHFRFKMVRFDTRNANSRACQSQVWYLSTSSFLCP